MTITPLKMRHDKHPAFYRFKELPAELQLSVWTFAIPDPRVITYSTNYITWDDWRRRTESSLHLHTVKTTYPGILGACFDSRAEALKRYQPAFSVELGRPIYVDFARDTFEFGDFASLQAFSIKNTPFSRSKMESDRIKTVGITLEWQLSQSVFTLLCSNFGKIKTLMVREEGGSELDMSPLSEFQGKEIAETWPWIMGRVRRNIEARGGDWTAWKPPLVIRGTEGQWKHALRRDIEEAMEDMDWEAGKRNGEDI